VVRRVLPGETGPSGGPAMTDVLGTLTSWDSATCVVATDSGPAVTIPLADLVTGKPVPPRGSVRQRVSAREAEVRALPLWVSPATEPLGEWVLRLVEGERGRGSRRANSCLAIGDPGLPLADAAREVVDFYAARGRVATAQVEEGSDVERALVGAGWREGEAEDAPYLVGSLVMALRAAGSADEVEVAVDDTRFLATVWLDGVEAGRVRAELNGDWLGVHGLRVDASRRRGGLARRLMAGLLTAGAEVGAATVWLEVDRSNTPAWMLYAGLGLREHHRCRYLHAPDAATQP
jgi:ribosomal protein S18 acetylase RimI-like enzyme